MVDGRVGGNLDAGWSEKTIGLDSSECDQEPIETPGSIQPHGILLVLDDRLVVRQASENAAAWFQTPIEKILERPIAEILGYDQIRILEPVLLNPDLPKYPEIAGQIEVSNDSSSALFLALAHCWQGSRILELELLTGDEIEVHQGLYKLTQDFLTNLEETKSVEELARLAAASARRLTGYNRVLVYRFDSDWNGNVIAEDSDGVLPSFLGRRFPASDLPRQARELYTLNRIRQIPDSSYHAVPIVPEIHPQTGRRLDQTFCTLRSVSPHHIQYMKAMGTPASMSVSIVRDGRLWGLIAFHHQSPRLPPYQVRLACDFLGKIFSAQIAARERSLELAERVKQDACKGLLLTLLAGESNFVEGLLKHGSLLLQFADAKGAAVVVGGRCSFIGNCPPETHVRKLVEWLGAEGQELFHSDSIGELLPEFVEVATVSSGVLSISISKLYPNYVVWFKPEHVQSVEWAGDPTISADAAAGLVKLSSPACGSNRSFEVWKQSVRSKSSPWSKTVVESAAELRNALVGLVLESAEELARLTSELKRSNEELEAFSYSISHDLRAPFRHILGYAQLLREGAGDKLDGEHARYLDSVIESAQQAGVLVDSLLSYSKMGRSAIMPSPVDMNLLVDELVREFSTTHLSHKVRFKITPLPTVECDLLMIKTVLTNLLSNSIKFTREKDEAEIEIGCRTDPEEYIFYVRDNGVGFDMRYYQKLFGVFQRLHRSEEFEGTGIGLASVRRMVARHGGSTWAKGEIGKGATFFFSLPKHDKHREGK